MFKVSELEKNIFEIQTEIEFQKVALAIFHFQYKNNPVYREFCNLCKRTNPKTIAEIPFLPISFFKSHKVKTDGLPVVKEFLSSGTTGMIRSSHLLQNLALYHTSFRKTYARYLGNPKEQIIIALLPSYLAQGNSSLLCMVDALIKASENDKSGYFLDDLESMPKYINEIKNNFPDKEIVIFGVSYALLDLAEAGSDLSACRIIETGGMKGRRKEMTKEELHETLEKAFGVDYISSEYGMTELLSQAYSKKNQIFESPNWLKIQIRDINDAFTYLSDGKTGGINVIDLANLYSCSFIATQDLGKIVDGGFKVLGRFDNSDIRGCNLLVN